MTEEQLNAQKLLCNLYKACWRSSDFKKKLLQNPIKTIEKITGKAHELPEGFRVVVEDQSDDNSIYFNIPPKPNR